MRKYMFDLHYLTVIGIVTIGLATIIGTIFIQQGNSLKSKESMKQTLKQLTELKNQNDQLLKDVNVTNKLLEPFKELAHKLFPSLQQKEALDKLYLRLQDQELQSYIHQVEDDPELFKDVFPNLKVLNIGDEYYPSFKNIFMSLAQMSSKFGTNEKLQMSFQNAAYIIVIKFHKFSFYDRSIMKIISDYATWIFIDLTTNEKSMFKNYYLDYLKSINIEDNIDYIYNILDMLVTEDKDFKEFETKFKMELKTERYELLKILLRKKDNRSEFIDKLFPTT